MSKFLLQLFAAALLALMVPAAHADELPTKPMLRIETGMHTAQIGGISMDAAHRYVVTGSQDKTVRVWDVQSGRLLQTLRPPIAEGEEGMVSYAAISPDAGTIVCGHRTGLVNDEATCFYVFDRATGRLRQRVNGTFGSVYCFAYSPDGKHLAVTSRQGLAVYRTADYTLAAQDNEYGGKTFGADFDGQGRLVTACDDGYVRLYDAAFHLLIKRKPLAAGQPYSARFSPDGARIAVGYDQALHVDVVSGTDLAALYAPDTHLADNGDLGSTAWSADGRFLYAGGRFASSDNCNILRWAEGGKGASEMLDTRAHNTLFDLRSLPSGGVLFASADPCWGVVGSGKAKEIRQRAQTADFRFKENDILLSDNAAQVQFAYESSGNQFARLNVATRELQTGLAAQTIPGGTLHSPLTQGLDLNITDWANNYTPKLNGALLPLQKSDYSRSLAIAPKRQSFLLGTEYSVYCFDTQGKQTWSVPAPGPALQVNVSGNGKVGVAAFGDGTIRWYRMTDGRELLAFFPHADRKRWALWTPSGYYDASPGGEDLLGWHVNRGQDQAADFFPASRFRSAYYRPDVIARVLDTLDESEALQLANAEAGKRVQAVSIAQSLPPIVRIVSPAEGVTVSTPRLTLKYALRAPSGEPITQVKVLIDGRPVGEARKFEETNAPVQEDKEVTQETTLTLPERDCTVSLLAYNKYAVSVPATIQVRWQGKPAPPVDLARPHLYILAIGVGNYQDGAVPTLTYPAKDARDFVTALSRQKGLLYGDVTVRLLTDEKATKDAILDGLDWLQKETTSKDVAMVFLSGHGLRDRTGDYYFLPVNYVANKSRVTGLPFYEIQKTVESLAGKTLFFVDSCHSGFALGSPNRKSKGDGPDINAIVNELSSVENGAVVFAASTGREEAQEDPEWQNGAFTKALLEGLGGKADVNHSGRITITMLEFYVSERVKALTKGEQHPTMRKPDVIPDFPLAILR